MDHKFIIEDADRNLVPLNVVGRVHPLIMILKRLRDGSERVDWVSVEGCRQMQCLAWNRIKSSYCCLLESIFIIDGQEPSHALVKLVA